MRRHLPAGSWVHILPVEQQLDEHTGHYEGLAHVSRITMARLLIPELLPCVRKAIWIDVDAIVVRPLAPLFAVRPKAPCGVAGRSSKVKDYLDHYDGPNRKSLEGMLNDTKTFNAGVVVMDLDILRTPRGEYESYMDVVKRVGFKYGNDDQVTLNLWCAQVGGYTELDPRWNVFNNMDQPLHYDNNTDLGDEELDISDNSNDNNADNTTEASRHSHGGDEELHISDTSEWGVVHFASSHKPWSPDARFAVNATRAVWERYAEDYWGEKFYNPEQNVSVLSE